MRGCFPYLFVVASLCGSTSCFADVPVPISLCAGGNTWYSDSDCASTETCVRSDKPATITEGNIVSPFTMSPGVFQQMIAENCTGHTQTFKTAGITFEVTLSLAVAQEISAEVSGGVPNLGKIAVENALKLALEVVGSVTVNFDGQNVVVGDGERCVVTNSGSVCIGRVAQIQHEYKYNRIDTSEHYWYGLIPGYDCPCFDQPCEALVKTVASTGTANKVHVSSTIAATMEDIDCPH